ncbi:hypothetical protein CFOL_v3_22856 [Cephalotus follicularis]|uniref:DUF4219 domain-containing protein n=1 Tax=Cephalotus follicularis TaxID=3775 RepID=A0A1Q3CH39_CEPFO|nr:hypothetical protein CFOL_v3_22856 [Cephalotus follicularis]
MATGYLFAPPFFRGEYYGFWLSSMMTYLKAFNLWDTVVNGCSPPNEELPDDTSLNQIKKMKKESMKNFKELSLLYSTVSDTLFHRIVSVSTTNEACDTLKEEF